MVRKFSIERPDEALRPAIQNKIDNLNKPKGSLGVLEVHFLREERSPLFHNHQGQH